jgi:TetR/AcrR family transcriptional repressor of nem operon
MPSAATEQGRRNPDHTRERILTVALHEIYRHGFRAVSIDTILSTAGITKGALYHHFSSKKELGYAVVDELLGPRILQSWEDVLEEMDDPIAALSVLRRRMLGIIQACVYGCPLNNLAQEMSPVDEGFRERVAVIFEHWIALIEAGLRRGQQSGHVRADVDPKACAAFILASIQGGIGLAKSARSETMLNQCFDALTAYEMTLRRCDTEVPTDNKQAALP